MLLKLFSVGSSMKGDIILVCTVPCRLRLYVYVHVYVNVSCLPNLAIGRVAFTRAAGRRALGLAMGEVRHLGSLGDPHAQIEHGHSGW